MKDKIEKIPVVLSQFPVVLCLIAFSLLPHIHSALFVCCDTQAHSTPHVEKQQVRMTMYVGQNKTQTKNPTEQRTSGTHRIPYCAFCGRWRATLFSVLNRSAAPLTG